jgi:hypothetical protein
MLSLMLFTLSSDTDTSLAAELTSCQCLIALDDRKSSLLDKAATPVIVSFSLAGSSILG